MAQTSEQLVAQIDFVCIADDCGATVRFDLMTLKENDGQVVCANCHRPYKFNRPFLKKLEKLRRLVLAIKDAEDIIDDCNVAVSVPGHEVALPYRLLLTRMNTLISLKVSGRTIDFNFRVEPLNRAFK